MIPTPTPDEIAPQTTPLTGAAAYLIGGALALAIGLPILGPIVLDAVCWAAKRRHHPEEPATVADQLDQAWIEEQVAHLDAPGYRLADELARAAVIAHRETVETVHAYLRETTSTCPPLIFPLAARLGLEEDAVETLLARMLLEGDLATDTEGRIVVPDGGAR